MKLDDKGYKSFGCSRYSDHLTSMRHLLDEINKYSLFLHMVNSIKSNDSVDLGTVSFPKDKAIHTISPS